MICWTEEEVAILKKYYKNRPVNVTALQKHLPNKTRKQIYAKAKRMSISSQMNWTDDEMDYLSNWWGRKTVPELAKGLRRSEYAIIKKAYKLSLGKGITPWTWRLYEIAEATGIQYKTIYHYLKEGILIGSKLNACWCVTSANILDFLHKNPGSWNACRAKTLWHMILEKQSMDTTLTSLPRTSDTPMPDWLQEQFENATKIRPAKHHTPWTKYEIGRVESMLLRGMTYASIAIEIGRTAKAVQHQMLKMYKNKKAVLAKASANRR